LFLTRLFTTVTLLTSLSFLIIFSHGPFGILIPFILAALSFFGIKEYFLMMKNKEINADIKILPILSIFYIFCVYKFVQYPVIMMNIDSLFIFLSLFIAFISRFFLKSSLSDVAKTSEVMASKIFAFIYIPWSLAFLIKILFFINVDGRMFVFFVILASKATDIFAYITGKLIGKQKLAKNISPNKTVEGAIGGILGSICTGIIAQITFMKEFLSITQVIFIALVISVISILGDLAESLIKRDTGFKDSGASIPGLGGVLDLVDSILFTVPAMYFIMVLIS